MTLGSLRALRERGCRVPDDVTLVGFDDAPWTSLVTPPLSVVARSRRPRSAARPPSCWPDRGNRAARPPRRPRPHAGRPRELPPPWTDRLKSISTARPSPGRQAGADKGNPTWTHHRPPRPFEVDIDDDQVAFFHENGYLAIERITTDEEIEWLRGRFDELFEARQGGARRLLRHRAPLRRRGRRPVRPGALPRAGRARPARDPVRAERQAHRLQAARRRPRRRPPLGPHALEAGPHRGVGAVAPGRGLLGSRPRLPRRRQLDAPRRRRHRQRLPLVPPRLAPPRGARPQAQGRRPRGAHPRARSTRWTPVAAVPVPTRAGGASFHHPRMLHHSRPNTTDRDRRAYANEYQTRPVQRDVPAERPWITEVARPSRPERCSRRRCDPDRAATNPAVVDPSLDSRAVSFESPGGERGAGGSAAGGRKGASEQAPAPRRAGRPRRHRGARDGAPHLADGPVRPARAAPRADPRGLLRRRRRAERLGARGRLLRRPHGRPVDYDSALTSILEGRGFNSYLPMPFRERIRVEIWNAAPVRRSSTTRSTTRCRPSCPTTSACCTPPSGARTPPR